jgi:hypothetical protein
MEELGTTKTDVQAAKTNTQHIPCSTAQPVSIHPAIPAQPSQHPSHTNLEKREPSHLHTTATVGEGGGVLFRKCGFMPGISGMVQVGSQWGRNGVPVP